MRIQHFILAAGLILAAASPATLAQDSSWTLRIHGAILESSAGSQTSFGNGVASNVDVGSGVGIGVEYRVSDRIGLEFSTLFAGLEVGYGLSSRALAVQNFELTMMPLTLAVPFHFDTGRRADLFVGPTFSIVQYLDMETYVGATGAGARFDVGNDAALGAAFGADVPFGKGKWAFSAGLRYMKTSAGDTDLDPVIVTLGFACRF